MNNTNELSLKLMLTLARDRRAMQGRVRSVGFMREYGLLPEQLGSQTLSQLTEIEREQLAREAGIKPKSAAAHFHVYLNDVRYHLLQWEQNAIVVLDNLTDEQWSKLETFSSCQMLTTLQHSELNELALSSFEAEEVKKLIHYCLFEGSDQGPALHHAEGVFMFEDPFNMNSWTLMDKQQAIDFVIAHGTIHITEREGTHYYSLVLIK